jgi:hypothetical protein
MAALPILTRDEKNGSVFVEDRRPDGTIVVLRCAVQEGPASGVAARSHPPGSFEFFPMDVVEADRRIGGGGRLFASDFTLTIDTTELPAGTLSFDVDLFAYQVERAVEAGEKRIELTPEMGHRWGLRSDGELRA